MGVKLNQSIWPYQGALCDIRGVLVFQVGYHLLKDFPNQCRSHSRSGWATCSPGGPKWGKWEKFEENLEQFIEIWGKIGKWNSRPPRTVRLATSLIQTHPKHVFSMYDDRPQIDVFACFLFLIFHHHFPKFVTMTKINPIFQILDIAPLNNVCVYIAGSRKTTLIMYFFYKDDIQLANTSVPPCGIWSKDLQIPLTWIENKSIKKSSILRGGSMVFQLVTRIEEHIPSRAGLYATVWPVMIVAVFLSVCPDDIHGLILSDAMITLSRSWRKRIRKVYTLICVTYLLCKLHSKTPIPSVTY